MRPTLAIGDLHLVANVKHGGAGSGDVEDDLAQLLEANRGARLAIAGDLFDLSADHPGVKPLDALSRALAASRATKLLAEHVDRGGELWWVAGNHDAPVGEPEARELLLRAFDLHGAARDRVRISPWFLRENGFHLEHGHLYDPDNAVSHPLYPCVRSLGVQFVENFIAPTGAFRYLNANDETPLKLFIAAFVWYGARGPYVLYRYFRTAFGALARSGALYDDAAQIRIGRSREDAFRREHTAARFDEASSAHTHPSGDLFDDLWALASEPTLRSFPDTFRRLYLDRVAATVALTVGASLAVTRHRRAALAMVGAGALVMGTSWALGHDRYGGAVGERLKTAGEAIAERTNAKAVVFGHAHRETTSGAYANTASFAFPKGAPGRPYLMIDTNPSGAVSGVTRCYWSRRDDRRG